MRRRRIAAQPVPLTPSERVLERRQSAPVCGERGGLRGAACGKPANRRPATAAGSGVTAHVAAFHPRHSISAAPCPCWNRQFGPPDSRRGAAATVD